MFVDNMNVLKYLAVDRCEAWNAYLKKMNYKDRYNILIKNLDTESIAIVDVILERIKLICLAYELKKPVYASWSEWLIPQEKEFQKIVTRSKFVAKYKKKIPCSFFEEEFLVFHSGLKLLPDQIHKYIKDKDFIDGGACIGDSTLVFSEYYSPKTIYAVDPISENVTLLNSTIKMNDLTNVILVNACLGKTIGDIEIAYNSIGFGGSSVVYGGGQDPY
jgi:hypothetical protein